MTRLPGRRAVVTGAGSGIGRATAERFAAEGARVVVADIDEDHGRETAARIESDGGTATYCQVDVAESGSVRRLIEFTVDVYGGLDVLHNNAYWAPVKPLLETSEDEWDRTIDVTLKSVYLGCLHGLPVMIAAGGGVVINTASTSSLVVSRNFAAYAAAKGGVLQLTRSIAVDYGAQGIRANALLPGSTSTPATAELRKDEAFEERTLSRIALGRWAEPEDIAGAAVFLASDDSSFVTGSAMVVDGGKTAM